MSSVTFGPSVARRASPTAGVVAVVLAAGGALVAGSVALQAYWAIVAAVLAVALAALIVSRHSLWAGSEYSLLLASGLVAPFQLAGNITLPLVLAGLACAWWIGRQFLMRHVVMDASPVVSATLAFIGVALLSFLVGQYPWFPTPPAPMRAQLGGLALFVVSGGLLLAVGHQVKSLVQLQRLTWLFVAVGGLFAFQQALPPNAVSGLADRVTQPGSVGSMFWTWLVAMTFAQAFFNNDLSLPKRAGLALLGMVAIYRGLVVAFSWASGWLPPLVALGLLVALRFPRLAVGGAALAAAPAIVVSGMAWDKLMSGESYSWMTRLEAFSVVAEMLKTNPLLGFGPANYYHYTLLFPILGWWVRFNSHNNYVDLVAQTGFVGLATFGWLALQLLLMVVGLRRSALDGFSKAYATGALAGLVASLVAGLLADWIVPFAYNIGTTGFRSSLLFWFFLGGALALKRLTDRSVPVVVHP